MFAANVSTETREKGRLLGHSRPKQPTICDALSLVTRNCVRRTTSATHPKFNPPVRSRQRSFPAEVIEIVTAFPRTFGSTNPQHCWRHCCSEGAETWVLQVDRHDRSVLPPRWTFIWRMPGAGACRCVIGMRHITIR